MEGAVPGSGQPLVSTQAVDEQIRSILSEKDCGVLMGERLDITQEMDFDNCCFYFHQSIFTVSVTSNEGFFHSFTEFHLQGALIWSLWPLHFNSQLLSSRQIR